VRRVLEQCEGVSWRKIFYVYKVSTGGNGNLPSNINK
jgi:hypothetical protein